MDKTKVSVGSEVFDLSQSVPLEQQTWRQRLVMVSTHPNRFVGFISNPLWMNNPQHEAKTATLPDEFTLLHALVCIFNLRAQESADPSKGIVSVHFTAFPRAILPVELLSHANIRIKRYDHLLYVNEQPPELAGWIFHEYQAYFDPPKIQRAQLVPGQKMQ